MKKILLICISLCLVFLLISCKCKHEFSVATCTEPETCVKCGETQGKALGHTFEDSFTVVKEPTCIDSGLRQKVCTRCGSTVEEKILALGHVYGDSFVAIEPTCTEKGETQQVCTVCGYIKKVDIPATGHSYKEEIYLKDSVAVKVCSACQAISESKNDDIKDQKFHKLYLLDEFNNPTDAYIILADGFTGTYKTASAEGKISWKIEFTSDNNVYITIFEKGKDTNLSTVYYTSDTLNVKIEEKDKGKQTEGIAELTQSSSYNYNKLHIGTSTWLGANYACKGLFARNNEVNIIISNDKGSYTLGAINTSSLKEMFYDVSFYNELMELINAKKYDEAIAKFESYQKEITYWGEETKVWIDADTASYYGFNALYEQCIKDKYIETAKQFASEEKYIEAIMILREFNENYKDYYREEECQKLVDEWQAKCIGPAGGYVFYDKGEYSDGWRYLEAAPKDLKGTYAFLTQFEYKYYAYVGEPGETFKNNSYDYGVDYPSNKNYAEEYELELVEISEEEYVADAKKERNRERTNYYAASAEAVPIDFVKNEVGSGKENTEKLVEKYGELAQAAYAASEYSVNGYDDWFLPSVDEGEIMLDALGYTGIGKFRNKYGEISTRDLVFVSSSVTSDMLNQDLIGSTHTGTREAYRVRPIRRY